MNSIKFKHYLTGKDVVIYNPKENILGVVVGPVQGDKTGQDRTWLLLKDFEPTAVDGTAEEILTTIETHIKEQQ